jgi:hypothetical protein
MPNSSFCALLPYCRHVWLLLRDPPSPAFLFPLSLPTTFPDLTMPHPPTGNILSVVGVVLCNKYIITHGFTYTMVLSASHFAFTSLGCHLMLRMGVFTNKKCAWKHVLPVALVSAVASGAARHIFAWLFVCIIGQC